MPKILVVDDEEDQEDLITQRFAHKPFLQGFEFVFARDGLKGLHLVKTEPDIELALIDINMPEMDGLTLLQKIKEVNPAIRSVMLSAYGDMSNIRTAMNNGAFDFLNKPIDMTDLDLTLKKTIEEVKRLKEAKRIHQENDDRRENSAELEMQILRTQMNPHFIFNSLNSINRFILQNNRDNASAYLNQFSRLVRLILENSRETLVSLQSELESMQLYLSLESLRFENRFTYQINLQPGLPVSSIKLPPLIIQPFAENAIWHGLMHKTTPGQLTIGISVEHEQLWIRITDDGVGREKAAELAANRNSSHKSMGMQITTDRIAGVRSPDAEKASVAITDLKDEAGNTGTEVLIKLPLLYD